MKSDITKNQINSVLSLNFIIAVIGTIIVIVIPHRIDLSNGLSNLDLSISELHSDHRESWTVMLTLAVVLNFDLLLEWIFFRLNTVTIESICRLCIALTCVSFSAYFRSACIDGNATAPFFISLIFSCKIIFGITSLCCLWNADNENWSAIKITWLAILVVVESILRFYSFNSNDSIKTAALSIEIILIIFVCLLSLNWISKLLYKIFVKKDKFSTEDLSCTFYCVTFITSVFGPYIVLAGYGVYNGDLNLATKSCASGIVYVYVVMLILMISVPSKIMFYKRLAAKVRN